MPRSGGKTFGSQPMYDALAPHYRDYSGTKAAYLAAIEQIVVTRVPKGARSMLDVGAADGVRAARIASALKVSTLVLAEPSEAMAALCRQQQASAVWQVGAESLPETDARFDVITCLWNVLGHVADTRTRILALRNMGRLLAPEGLLFFDVNNRYNASSYGWLRVAGRVVLDALIPSEERGDAQFTLAIYGKVIASMGHLFTPAELSQLLRISGLRTRNRYVVDYGTGSLRRMVFGGQLLFEVGE